MANMITNKLAIDRHYNLNRQIEDFCAPLKKYFGIDFFSYMQVYDNGDYLLLSNNHNFAVDYFKLEFGEMFIKDQISSNMNYKLFLWPKYPNGKMMNTYSSHGIWHGLTFVDIEDGYSEGVSFLANKENYNIISYYLKYSNILSLFIKEFKKKFSYEIYNNAVNSLAKFKSVGKFNINEPKYPDTKNFLGEIGYIAGEFEINGNPIRITQSSFECLELLSQGNSLKQIAQLTNRSPRTVEVLLNRIKDKTGIRFKSDLIKLFKEKLYL